MSRLRLFQEQECTPHHFPVVEDDQPVILAFHTEVRRHTSTACEAAVRRAQLLRENDCCPHCHHALVEPLELADATFGRNNLPVPGTATLVGFHCLRCHWEWPASTRQRSFG